MHNHAPENYQCPICIAVWGVENDDTWIKQDDIFYRDDFVVGIINSKFIKGNEGHAIIVPREHVENIYDLPHHYGNRIMEVAQAVAVAIKETRKSDGVTIQQNNEPAGGQHAFHYHMHVVPRFNGDHFYEESSSARKSLPEERVAYAQALRDYFVSHPLSLMKKGHDYIGVGVTFFCHDGAGRFVMGRRSKNARDEHGRWDLGGGTIEFGESADQTVRREIQEEYGADARELEFLGYMDVHREHEGNPTHWISLAFKVLVNPAQIRNAEPDMCDEVKWFTFADLPQDVHSQLPRFLERYKE